MNIFDQVKDFFRRLVKGRVDSAKQGARAKVWNAKARAKSKAAGGFNKAVDSRVDKVKDKAKKTVGGGPDPKKLGARHATRAGSILGS